MNNTKNNTFQASTLEDFGWNTFFLKNFLTIEIVDSVPARVISESKNSFQVYSKYGELTAKVSGRLHHQASEEKLYPAVGDWVAIKPIIDEGKAIIHAVLPRKSEFSRKVAGERTEKQVVSANIDTVFIVSTSVTSKGRIRRSIQTDTIIVIIGTGVISKSTTRRTQQTDTILFVVATRVINKSNIFTQTKEQTCGGIRQFLVAYNHFCTAD